MSVCVCVRERELVGDFFPIHRTLQGVVARIFPLKGKINCRLFPLSHTTGRRRPYLSRRCLYLSLPMDYEHPATP